MGVRLKAAKAYDMSVMPEHGVLVIAGILSCLLPYTLRQSIPVVR
jgi:hypothetical protein